VLFESLLSRADDYTLQQLLGRRAVKLIRLLSTGSMSLDLLRKALLSLQSPAELLLDRESRAQLVELLKPDELNTLGAVLAADGACRDGIDASTGSGQAGGVNPNRGAESTICYLMSAIVMANRSTTALRVAR